MDENLMCMNPTFMCMGKTLMDENYVYGWECWMNEIIVCVCIYV
jgi:hypothetical protein